MSEEHKLSIIYPNHMKGKN